MLKKILASDLYGMFIGAATTIQIGRLVLFVILVMGMWTYDVISGSIDRYKMSAEYDFSTVYYQVYIGGCSIWLNSETLDIAAYHQYPPTLVDGKYKSNTCITPDVKILRKIVNDQKYKTRAVNRKGGDVYGVYIFAFAIYFLSVIGALYSGAFPNSYDVFTAKGTIAGWVIVSIMLFPMTFRDNLNSATHEINGQTYYATSGYLSKDKQHWIKGYTTFIADVSHR